MEKPDSDWLMKCRQCKHYYQVQADADEVRCRLKYCRFEPLKGEKINNERTERKSLLQL